VREILKEYSKCPSYPQIFVSGLCIPGGLNYLREMANKGRFLDLFPQTEIIVRSSEKIERLV
jgi:glutaredoxin-related protein